jgi:hypothetical protein
VDHAPLTWMFGCIELRVEGSTPLRNLLPLNLVEGTFPAPWGVSLAKSGCSIPRPLAAGLLIHQNHTDQRQRYPNSL